MIESFRHRGLKELFETGRSRRVDVNLQRRIIRRLDALEAAERLESLNQPGFDFHPLRGRPQRYSIHVNGPWCITFEWEDGRAQRVDLEQYH
ncbi:MAG: type II toxin-antitoxin system RelE/ParE family toxin [Alphaproteobacteria bacterium]|nr:type II toxin-antitoxin system RelE/ParE family toxin [Alphaproteobacteria bacterium]MBV9968273.1 type II toxin-antitoxin system RelE/ParE family toxin [Alphaproteobacteria bacterium]